MGLTENSDDKSIVIGRNIGKDIFIDIDIGMI